MWMVIFSNVARFKRSDFTEKRAHKMIKLQNNAKNTFNELSLKNK